MFINFKNEDSLKNSRLHSLIMQVRRLNEGDYWKVGSTILKQLKKILPLAKEEAEWYLYLETFQNVICYENNFGEERNVVKYAPIFYRDSNAYYKEAMAQYPNGTLPKGIMTCYDVIFECYRLFPQIDDKKWEQFWQGFRTAVEMCGNEIYYWECRLCFDILMRDVEAAKASLKQFKKQSVDYGWTCYACINDCVLEYYILVNDIPAVDRYVEHILSKQVPSNAMWMYNICHRTNVRYLYNLLLNYCVRSGNSEIFARYLPKYLEAWENDKTDQDATVAYRRACAGDFSGMEEEKKIAAADMGKLSSTNEKCAMEQMLNWAAYFRKLFRNGVEKIEFSTEASGIPAADREGMFSVKELSEWCEKQADMLGRQFEQSWKRFHYQPLKESFFLCCGLTDSVR